MLPKNMIAIVGAGPAGSYLGHLLAKEGKDVCIFEEHSRIGSPVQCTGIVTHSIEKFLESYKGWEGYAKLIDCYNLRKKIISSLELD